jgi:hypothetical protein
MSEVLEAHESPEAAPTPKKRKFVRRLLQVFTGVVVVAVLLVMFTPFG